MSNEVVILCSFLSIIASPKISPYFPLLWTRKSFEFKNFRSRVIVALYRDSRNFRFEEATEKASPNSFTD